MAWHADLVWIVEESIHQERETFDASDINDSSNKLRLKYLLLTTT